MQQSEVLKYEKNKFLYSLADRIVNKQNTQKLFMVAESS